MIRHRPQHSNAEIAARYLSGTSLSELCMRCHASPDTIKAILHAYDVPLRSMREAQALARVDRKARTEKRRQKLAALDMSKRF